MKVLLSVDERREAYKHFIKGWMRIQEDDELIVTMPCFSSDSVTVEIVKKPPQEQPQE